MSLTNDSSVRELMNIAQMNDIDLGHAMENKIAIDDAKYPADVVRGRNEKYNEY